MFGFMRKNPPRPMAPHQTAGRGVPRKNGLSGRFASDVMLEELVPEGMELVTKEDIYSRETDTLLLRKGQVVAAEQLPKLIRHGAVPTQFLFRQRDGSGRVSDMPPRAAEKLTMSAPEPVKKPAEPGVNGQIVILERDQSAIRRLLDCLVLNEVPLARIHVVRDPAQMEWALQKYRPEVVIADARFQSQVRPIDLSECFGGYSCIRRMIITLPLAMPAKGSDAADWRNRYEKAGALVLQKPINRFALKSALAVRPAGTRG